jgi:ATP-dependent RNA helicase DDX19/DBP5
MEREGHRCTSITGEMDKADRDRTVTEFREGITKILIATDVLARGFDVTQVSLLVLAVRGGTHRHGTPQTLH